MASSVPDGQVWIASPFIACGPILADMNIEDVAAVVGPPRWTNDRFVGPDLVEAGWADFRATWVRRQLWKLEVYTSVRVVSYEGISLAGSMVRLLRRFPKGRSLAISAYELDQGVQLWAREGRRSVETVTVELNRIQVAEGDFAPRRNREESRDLLAKYGFSLPPPTDHADDG
jgi:hypothetical protein